MVELGDNCSNDYECVAKDSRCIDVCSCKVDHVMSSDGKRCLKAANSVGEPCQEDSQCQLFLKDTKCGPNGRCSCVENFHQRGSICLKDISEHYTYSGVATLYEKINSINHQFPFSVEPMVSEP